MHLTVGLWNGREISERGFPMYRQRWGNIDVSISTALKEGGCLNKTKFITLFSSREY